MSRPDLERLRRAASGSSSSGNYSTVSRKAQITLSFEKMKMYFAFDAFIIFSCAVSLSLYAFKVIEMPTAMYFIPPFFSLLISTLFFVIFIAWFPSVFKFSKQEYEINVIIYALRCRFLSNGLIFLACLISAPFFWRNYVSEKENYERVNGKGSINSLKHDVSTRKEIAYSKMVMSGSGVVTALIIFPIGIMMLDNFNRMVYELREFYLDSDEERRNIDSEYILIEGVL